MRDATFYLRLKMTADSSQVRGAAKDLNTAAGAANKWSDAMKDADRANQKLEQSTKKATRAAKTHWQIARSASGGYTTRYTPGGRLGSSLRSRSGTFTEPGLDPLRARLGELSEEAERDLHPATVRDRQRQRAEAAQLMRDVQLRRRAALESGYRGVHFASRGAYVARTLEERTRAMDEITAARAAANRRALSELYGKPNKGFGDRFIGGMARGGSKLGNVGLAASAGLAGGAAAAAGYALVAALGRVLDAMKAFTVGAIQVAADWRRTEMALKNIEATPQVGSAVFERLKQLGTEPGVEFKGATHAYMQMRGAGYGTDTSLALIREIGNITQLYGKGPEDFDRAMIALSQIGAKGKLQAEELVKQLGNALPIARILKAEFGSIEADEIIADVKTIDVFVRRFLSQLEKQKRAVRDITVEAKGVRLAWDEIKSAFGQAFVGTEGQQALIKLKGLLGDLKDDAAAVGDWLAKGILAAMQLINAEFERAKKWKEELFEPQPYTGNPNAPPTMSGWYGQPPGPAGDARRAAQQNVGRAAAAGARAGANQPMMGAVQGASAGTGHVPGGSPDDLSGGKDGLPDVDLPGGTVAVDPIAAIVQAHREKIEIARATYGLQRRISSIRAAGAALRSAMFDLQSVYDANNRTAESAGIRGDIQSLDEDIADRVQRIQDEVNRAKESEAQRMVEILSIRREMAQGQANEEAATQALASALRNQMAVYSELGDQIGVARTELELFRLEQEKLKNSQMGMAQQILAAGPNTEAIRSMLRSQGGVGSDVAGEGSGWIDPQRQLYTAEFVRLLDIFATKLPHVLENMPDAVARAIRESMTIAMPR